MIACMTDFVVYDLADYHDLWHERSFYLIAYSEVKYRDTYITFVKYWPKHFFWRPKAQKKILIKVCYYVCRFCCHPCVTQAQRLLDQILCENVLKIIISGWNLHDRLFWKISKFNSIVDKYFRFPKTFSVFTIFLKPGL